MWARWVYMTAFLIGLAPQANAGEFHRVSCSVVRFYVAKYSAPAAEAWARSKGASEAEIESARRCIKDSPIQTATDTSSTFR
jgi:hypothetical protein